MKTNHLRIIAGRFRGRKIAFLDEARLRPTPNRVRETLFNWLAPVIRNARCLDLFSGSGALSFEAISRGARFCQLYDSSLKVVKQLQLEAQKLGIENINIKKAHAPKILTDLSQAKPFDVVFLDPPFYSNLIAVCTKYLEQNNWLNKQAFIYIEAEKNLTHMAIPANWEMLHNKIAGNVTYYLFKRK